MKKFNIPEQYKSGFIGKLKEIRKISDPRKKDFTPMVADFGPVRFLFARHFGFCYGVENAIEKAYAAVDENPGKRIFLLSQMIHNPIVNKDLEEKGIQFIMDTSGNMLMDWSELKGDDVVLIPAFGTTLEIEEKLSKLGIETQKYNTTCPFVEKVWKRSDKLGEEGYSIIIHGKHNHEETRATFSHANASAPSIIIRNMEEAEKLGDFIKGSLDLNTVKSYFDGRYSIGFDFQKDLTNVGVVNQTTMLAEETQAIADYFKNVMLSKYGEKDIQNHFADTRDTLCYATNDNQKATYGLLETDADLAIVVGGYNSSNTSHLVELLEGKFPTYFISDKSEIKNKEEVHHFIYEAKEKKTTKHFIPDKEQVTIILTSGASCPDRMVEEVMQQLLSYFPNVKEIDSVTAEIAS